MIRRILMAAMLLAALPPAHATEGSAWGRLAALRSSASAPAARTDLERHARGGGCKSMASCRDAVEAWCGGSRDLDRDDDGIPCESICRSKAQVDKIRAEIGC